MTKIPFVRMALLLTSISMMGQLFDSEVYKANPWIDGAITLGATGTNLYGLKLVDKKNPLDSAEISPRDGAPPFCK